MEHQVVLPRHRVVPPEERMNRLHRPVAFRRYANIYAPIGELLDGEPTDANLAGVGAVEGDRAARGEPERVIDPAVVRTTGLCAIG